MDTLLLVLPSVGSHYVTLRCAVARCLLLPRKLAPRNLHEPTKSKMGGRWRLDQTRNCTLECLHTFGREVQRALGGNIWLRDGAWGRDCGWRTLGTREWGLASGAGMLYVA